MNNRIRVLTSNLLKKIGFEDNDLNQLIELLVDESEKAESFKESVCDTVNAYHNEKKELITVIEELVIVLSSTREYEIDRTAYSDQQEQLLWETGSEALIKALRVLNKNN